MTPTDVMNATKVYFRILIFLYILSGAWSAASADAAAAPFRLTRAMVDRYDAVFMNQQWSAHAGDSAAWARANVNDRAWRVVDCPMEPGKPRPDNWAGIGWFRRHLEIDSSLVDVPLALQLYQAGACDIYLDGRMIGRYGTVGTASQKEISFQSESPLTVSFLQPGRHVLAVRFSNYSAAANGAGFYSGFSIAIGESGRLNAMRSREIAENLTTRMVFGAVPLSLALLHLILFAFYPRIRANLYYSLCMIGFSGIVFATTQQAFSSSFGEIVGLVRLAYVAENMAIIFGLLMLYTFVAEKIPTHGWIIVAVSFALAVNAFMDLGLTMRIQDLFLILVIAEMIRGTIFAKAGSPGDGGWIIAAGMGVLMISLIFQLLIGFNVIPPISVLKNGYLYGALALAVSMSIYLSRRFAQTNEDLGAQLVQIRELSARMLEQERQAKEQEIQQRLLEADNKRKTEELEEARKVQLSMLPACLNDIPGYDICFSMRTATEIGGDYYDYLVGADGTLSVVIGDATGHGLKSALMVATVKSLFSAMGASAGITEFFGRSTDIIKDMNLGNLFMSMTFLRLSRGEYEVSAAGMPPLLVYRAAERKVESVMLKGMPLGAHKNFPYQRECGPVHAGDILILMSDGYTELFNSRREMLEPALIERAIAGSAHGSASDVVRALYETGDAWRGSRAQDDDITFAAIKILPHPSSKTI